MCQTDQEALEQARRAVSICWQMLESENEHELPIRSTIRSCLKKIAFYGGLK